MGPRCRPRGRRGGAARRRPGKQPGAGGSALFQTSDPDEIVDHVPDACGGCGSDLAGASPAGVVRRQVHDIPAITPVVVEHRLHKRRCGCGATTTATAPAGVGAAAVYGPNLRALAVYLLVFQHIPVARTQTLIADLTGARPVDRLDQLGAAPPWPSVLVDVEKLIKSLIVLAHVIHVDETSSNINGARWWLHVASTDEADRLPPAPLPRTGGGDRVRRAARVPRNGGPRRAVSVYDTYHQARHALCGAHIGPRTRRRRRSRSRPGLARAGPARPARAQHRRPPGP